MLPPREAMSYLDTSVRQLNIFEGCVPTMYRDTVGRVTVGVGNMLSGVADALKLPFRIQSSGDMAGEPAVRADYSRVLAMAFGHLPSFYAEDDALVLDQADIDALLLTRLQGFDAQLHQDFPDFDSYPEAAKLGLMDMVYNLGNEKLVDTYPHFDAAVRARNWTVASQECARDSSVKAFAERNLWTHQQFLAAAEAECPQ